MQHPSQQSELDSSLIAHSFGRFRHQECYHAGALCLFGFRCRYLPHSPGPASSLPPLTLSTTRPQEEEELRLWKSCSGSVDPPTGNATGTQKAWDRPVAVASASSLISKASPIARARLLASQQKEAVLGSLLHLCLH